MALSQSKRKRPDREDKPMHEKGKITNLVLDESTSMTLVHYINTKLIKSVDYPISTGKEAMVFRATAPDGRHYAIKCFKYETSAFVHMSQYIDGDPRFRLISHNQRDVVRAWARKEYANLLVADKAHVPAPKPVACKNNVVVMEFLGEAGVPYARLSEYELENPKQCLTQCVENMRAMLSAGLVHADLSPYNILVGYDEDGNEKILFIDLGTAVALEHPRAKEFLLSDCRNIATHFNKLGIKASEAGIFENITGKKP